jgi:hypothetical protein
MARQGETRTPAHVICLEVVSSLDQNTSPCVAGGGDRGDNSQPLWLIIFQSRFVARSRGSRSSRACLTPMT